MIQDLLAEAEQRMSQAVDHVVSEFATVRTGRANPQILNRITVDYYGTPTPVLQLASVNVPEPRLMVVSPYDPGSLNDIEKAIASSDLGLSASSDGKDIRIASPHLTEEGGMELAKAVRSMAEEGRVTVRNLRRQTKTDIDALQAEISDDDIRRAEKDLQDL